MQVLSEPCQNFTLDITCGCQGCIFNIYLSSKAQKSKPRNSSSIGFAYRNFIDGKLSSLCISHIF